MAKATKRKSPARRKPAATRPRSSGLAFSGWIVAAGLGAALIGSQSGLVPKNLFDKDLLEKMPSLETLQAMAGRDEDSVRSEAAEPRRPKAEGRPAPVARPAEAPRSPPALPPMKSDTIAEVVRKAEAKAIRLPPKPQIPTAPTALPFLPPVPIPPSETLVTSAIRKEPVGRAPTVRVGDLAIRRYPFTTAPAVAYVGDLRTVRILSGEGDWKKVEVSATGVTGWLRLQRLGSASPATERSARPSGAKPTPAASLLDDAKTVGSR